MWEMTSEAKYRRGPGVLIGLTGKAGTGKDTVGNYIRDTYGFQTLSFAGPLKKGVSALFDIPMETLFSRTEKEQTDPRYNRSPRELLQWLGTDVLRDQVDKDFFVKHMGWRLDRILLEEGGQVVVTDVRFDNEAEVVRAYGGQVWRVDASLRLPQSCLIGQAQNHETEKGISSFYVDKVLDNNGDLTALKRNIDELVWDMPEMADRHPRGSEDGDE